MITAREFLLEMRKWLRRLVLILAIILTLGTGESLAGHEESSKIAEIDKAIRSVVFLSVPDEKSQEKLHSGTGFLINANNHFFIFTAAHVATLMSSESSVTFGDDTGQAHTVSIKKLVIADSPNWTFHSKADVAALHIDSESEYLANLASRAILSEKIRGTLEAPARSQPLTTIGFPLGLGVSISPGSKFSPISKESKTASALITLPRFDTKTPSEFFILDSPSVGGFSGSPVFVLPAAYSRGNSMVFSSAMYCIGLVHGTLSDNTGGKFAAIVPSAHIIELLQAVYSEAVSR